MKDEKALNAAMKQYRELMTPVYQASGIRNTANNNSLTNVLDQDISRFVKQIANANGMGITKNGMLSHISQMMVQRLNKQMKGEGDVDNIDILGNTTESAIQATKQAL